MFKEGFPKQGNPLKIIGEKSMKYRLTFFLAVIFLISGCAAKTSKDDGRIVIALVDTGISTAAIDPEKLLAGYNYVIDSEDTEDRMNHGTAVASIIAGCESAEVEAKADFAYLVPLVIADQVDGKTKQADADTLAAVIRDAIDLYHADIINLSLGVKTDTKALKSAVDYAEKKGVLIISAVGNNGDDGQEYYPASYDSVLAVGSCGKNGKESPFSQSGADIFAQGEGMLLASKNGYPYGIKGTSFATGIVSAHAAQYLRDDPELFRGELYQKLIEGAEAEGGCLMF